VKKVVKMFMLSVRLVSSRIELYVLQIKLTFLFCSSSSGLDSAVGTVEEGPIIRFIDCDIVSPDGRRLVKALNLDVPLSTNIMITGPNGCGKSSLFRVLGELWPPYSGKVVKPARDGGDIVFVPQKPYLVMGTLRDQIIYPHSADEMKKLGITDDDLVRLLDVVDPARSIVTEWKFDDVKNWTIALSGGQKQRVAMARVFYHRPRYAILDECTSAVSSEVEGKIYTTCKTLGITIFTVSHRALLQQYHEFQLRLDGHGNWAFLTREAVTNEQVTAAAALTSVAPRAAGLKTSASALQLAHAIAADSASRM